MTNENAVFVSPQTGSEYVRVTMEEDTFVAVRFLGKDDQSVSVFRITVRSNDFGTLMSIRSNDDLMPMWSGIKNDDHFSVVVPEVFLKKFIEQAVMAVKAATGTVTVNENWFTEVAEGTNFFTQECPACGAIITK